MNTSSQSHSDLIWTLVLDRTGTIILVAAILVGLIVLGVFARRPRRL